MGIKKLAGTVFIIVSIFGTLFEMFGITDWFKKQDSATLQNHSGSGDIIAGDKIGGDKYEFNGDMEVSTIIKVQKEYENKINTSKINTRYETRYWITIAPSRSLASIKFQVKTKESILSSLDVLPISKMGIGVSGNDMDSGITNIRWKRYPDPAGRYRMTIYSTKRSDYQISFIPDPEENIKIIDEN